MYTIAAETQGLPSDEASAIHVDEQLSRRAD